MAINLNYFKTRVVRYPLLTLTFTCALIVTGYGCGLKPADWASWVQAFGSIGAIIGTWYATKTQLLHDERTRKKQSLEDDVANAQIAFDLVTDTSRALRNVMQKFESAYRQGRKITIGTERLEALSLSLQHFAAKPIPPQLYAEVLCMQRETSYTITAIAQQNRMSEVDVERVTKATSRCMAVFQSQQRVAAVLTRAIGATGTTEFSIGPTNAIEDSEWGN